MQLLSLFEFRHYKINLLIVRIIEIQLSGERGITFHDVFKLEIVSAKRAMIFADAAEF